MKKRKVFVYGGIEGIRIREIRTKENLFPTTKEQFLAAYCNTTFDYSEGIFVLHLYYYNPFVLKNRFIVNNSIESNFLEPGDTHEIKMSLKKMMVFLEKIGYEELRFNFDYVPNIVEEKINSINRYLYNIVFVASENEMEAYVDEAMYVYDMMKEEYNKAINYIENNREKSLIQKKQRVEKLKIINHVTDLAHGSFLRLYNVGQANCSALYYTNTESPLVVFDLGADGKTKNDKLEEMLKKLDGNGFIVISHFDLDHYNLYKLLSKESFNRLFIVHEFPRTLNGNQSALAYQLYLNGAVVYEIKNDSILNVEDYEDFEVFKICQGLTSRMNHSQKSLENAHSLVSMIKINDKEAIIPGDALEDGFVIEKDKEFLYGIISHHGCKVGDMKLPYFVYNSFLPVDRVAKKNYCHPQKEHILLYKYVVRFGKDNAKMFSGSTIMKDNLTCKKDSDYIDWYF